MVRRRARVIVWVLLAFGVLLVLSGALLAIAFPKLSLQWAERSTDQCLSHLRRLSQAALAYAEDHSGYLPPAGVWMDALRPSLSASRDLRCPKFGSERDRYGYALNSEIAARPLSRVAEPSRTFLLYDSANLARNASDPVTTLPPEGRHRTKAGPGNNAASADGKVRFRPIHTSR
ncbi:MAG: hypothetical protein HRF45_12815 [Fimbriimonadia bacterium]